MFDIVFFDNPLHGRRVVRPSSPPSKYVLDPPMVYHEVKKFNLHGSNVKRATRFNSLINLKGKSENFEMHLTFYYK